jgi:thiamine-monophosphate kinase
MRLIDEVHENRLLGRLHESDAELLPLGDGRLLALTVDTVDEEVRAGLYREPATAGRIAAIAAFSDLAAVGADPLGLLLAVGLPEEDAEDVQCAVAVGVAEVCRSAGVGVLGGDTNRTASLSVACTGVGVVGQGEALMRVGLRPGDLLFATGRLGLGSALAAARWIGLPPALFAEHDYLPSLRLREGRALRGLASACIDTSDGLLAALDQLARLNDVAVEVEGPLERLLDAKAEAVRRHLALPAFPFLAGQHGEFELVFGIAPSRLSDLARVASASGWRPLRLGRAVTGEGLRLAGRLVDGARVRNLFAEVGGDVAAYVRALCGGEMEA